MTVMAQTPTRIAPYTPGDQVRVHDDSGRVLLARVEQVARQGRDFTVAAAVIAPRRFRNQMVVATVAEDGSSAHIEPYLRGA